MAALLTSTEETRGERLIPFLGRILSRKEDDGAFPDESPILSRAEKFLQSRGTFRVGGLRNGGRGCGRREEFLMNF